ncbi:MAG TPA: C1 family peptidase [Chryseosolibacter sp.]
MKNNSRRLFGSTLALLFVATFAWAQPIKDAGPEMTTIARVDHTSVKSQGNTGTCWSFSTVSLIESQTKKSNLGEFDLSEMFIVRHIYVNKAKNYLLRLGSARFSEGGLGNDVVNAINQYGAMPESIYSGLVLGQQSHDHSKMVDRLKAYLDALLAKPPVREDWLVGYNAILDDHLGKTPETFTYREKMYTPKTFASEVLKFKSEDYVFITSFTHHPYYKPFIIEIPDNYSNESYLNVPLNELISLTENAIEKGYSIMWDADVSNANFKQRNEGFAMMWKDTKATSPVNPDAEEIAYDAKLRQSLFENLTTQDDHLMHIVGLERSKGGKKFFVVKNSWGEIGPYKGYIKVSEAYFAINTVTLVVPRAAIDSSLAQKLGLK